MRSRRRSIPWRLHWSCEAEFEDADRELEARVAEWLAEDPEHWPIFRLVVLDPWQERPGQWRKEAPGWIRSLGRTRRLPTSSRIPMGGGACSTEALCWALPGMPASRQHRAALCFLSKAMHGEESRSGETTTERLLKARCPATEGVPTGLG